MEFKLLNEDLGYNLSCVVKKTGLSEAIFELLDLVMGIPKMKVLFFPDTRITNWLSMHRVRDPIIANNVKSLLFCHCKIKFEILLLSQHNVELSFTIFIL